MKLQDRIRLALGDSANCVLWRNQSGQYDANQLPTAVVGRVVHLLRQGNVTASLALLERALEPRWIRYGVGKGGSDLLGINRNGRMLALEVKEGGDKLTDDQTKFIQLVNSKGGYAAEVRSERDAIDAVLESVRVR